MTNTIDITTLYNESHEATYCPEDDKLRLYVGRVPREEYLYLKNEGWTSTPMQNCDFVGKWSVQKEKTAIAYAGSIEDEDQSPQDRAADRAERFSMYREKRRAEAHEQADVFDSMPMVHGYQSDKKAERAAARNTRIGEKAYTQWEKAEYWQQRTAGVISNALYKSTPAVRMGRIKELEKEQRKHAKAREQYNNERNMIIKCQTMEDQEKASKIVGYIMDSSWTKYTNPATGEQDTYYRITKNNNLTTSEYIDMYLAKHPELADKSRRQKHIELRLAYERQMLEAAGGLAGELEIQVGGYIGQYQIHQVNKSNATGRVVSVKVLTDKVDGYTYRSRNIPNTEHSYTQIVVEKINKSLYTQPTDEDIQKVKDFKLSLKKGNKTISLINPDIESAQRLQDILNEANKGHNYNFRTDSDKEQAIREMTQAEYSKRSKGDDSICKTALVDAQGNCSIYRRNGNFEPLCKVRLYTATPYGTANQVVVITDKPQKALPTFTQKVGA